MAGWLKGDSRAVRVQRIVAGAFRDCRKRGSGAEGGGPATGCVDVVGRCLCGGIDHPSQG